MIFKKLTFTFIFLSLLFVACLPMQVEDKVQAFSVLEKVNPFIGTGGHGHTFPGATAPFGMVQLSPDTRLKGWDGCSGYHYTDSIIYGFSHTHLSGTGVADYCDILLKPSIGEAFFENGYESTTKIGYASYFSKSSESASPGFYKVSLKEGIDVELTASERAGYHKYTFNQTSNSHIILDLEHRDKLLGTNLEIIDSTTVRGMRRSNSWAEDQFVFFFLKFSKPFTKVKTQTKAFSISENITDSLRVKAIFNFEVKAGEIIEVKVGISAVDVEGAKNNLTKEIGYKSFETVRKETEQLWDKELSKIKVSGGKDEDLVNFYTSLYHSMIAPNLFSDVDGRYRKIVRKEWKSKEKYPIGQLSENENQYTVFSLWDTYRAAHPLYTIIDQKRTKQYIQTFLRQYQEGGQLPIWELAGNYTGCMIGYHSVSVISDAFTKGVRGFDANLALEAMVHSANLKTLGRNSLIKKGFIPTEDEPESVSKNLEYAYDDWCIATFADKLGEEKIANEFYQRAQSYKNLYNSAAKFLMGRNNGGWISNFKPEEVNFNYTEANGWQYSLAVPQDISGLIDLMGGEKELESHLDQLFTTSTATSGRTQVDITGLIGQYAHGNEPSHHMAYMYNFVGQPWKTQEKVHQILDEMYTNSPDGLSGNEDCGQMSAWFVLSAMGFYSVLPGSNEYVIGSPRFEKITIELENKNVFRINANNYSAKNKFIQAVRFNAETYSRSYITQEMIESGGELVFEMGETPNKEWANKHENYPKSKITQSLIAIVPSIEAVSYTIEDSMLVTMKTPETGANIYYTINGTEPNSNSYLYKKPFFIKGTKFLKAKSYSPRGPISKTVTANFIKIPKGRTVSLVNKYSNHYNGGGDNALINILRGGNEFRTGNWQGFEGKDLIATVNLGKETEINKLSLSCLQDIRSWIWFPKEVIFYTSNDGNNFTLVGKVKNDSPITKEGNYLKNFTVEIGSVKAKYIKVEAINYGENPPWHLSPGGTAWLFADEIIIE